MEKVGNQQPKVEAEVLGDEVEDKTASNLWASDHGGVAAKLTFMFGN